MHPEESGRPAEEPREEEAVPNEDAQGSIERQSSPPSTPDHISEGTTEPIPSWSPPPTEPIPSWSPPPAEPTPAWNPPGGWQQAQYPQPGWWPPPGAQPPVAAPPRRSHRVLAAIVACLVLVGAGIGIGWGLAGAGSPTSTSTSSSTAPITPVPQAGSNKGSSSPTLTPAQVAAKVDPAIVNVNTVIAVGPFGGGSFGGGSSAPRAEAAGTGMILTSSGEVLTNNHVIQGATRINVAIQGRTGTYSATVVGADPTDDVALLQIQGVSGLPTVTLADSSSVTVGQTVVALGNALGQGGTPKMTTGSVTGLDRSITVGTDGGTPEHLTGLIQTDSPISPGDSGGPLANASGQVIGMITAASTSGPDRRVSTVGFAIPANNAVDVVNQVRSGHRSPSIIIGPAGFLGVSVRNLDTTTASQLGLSANSGALVVDVVPGTPAAKAGITRLSAITAIDGTKITTADSLGPAIHVHRPGDHIRVTWVDKNGTHSATVSLVEGPAV